MNPTPHDMRARIAEARRRKRNAELNALMDEIDAEFEAERKVRETKHTSPIAEEVTEPTEDEQRYLERVSATELVNKITGRNLQAPLSPEASAQEIVERVRLKSGAISELRQIKRPARIINQQDV